MNHLTTAAPQVRPTGQVSGTFSTAIVVAVAVVASASVSERSAGGASP